MGSALRDAQPARDRPDADGARDDTAELRRRHAGADLPPHPHSPSPESMRDAAPELSKHVREMTKGG